MGSPSKSRLKFSSITESKHLSVVHAWWSTAKICMKCSLGWHKSCRCKQAAAPHWRTSLRGVRFNSQPIEEVTRVHLMVVRICVNPALGGSRKTCPNTDTGPVLQNHLFPATFLLSSSPDEALLRPSDRPRRSGSRGGRKRAAREKLPTEQVWMSRFLGQSDVPVVRGFNRRWPALGIKKAMFFTGDFDWVAWSAEFSGRNWKGQPSLLGWRPSLQW